MHGRQYGIDFHFERTHQLARQGGHLRLRFPRGSVLLQADHGNIVKAAQRAGLQNIHSERTKDLGHQCHPHQRPPLRSLREVQRSRHDTDNPHGHSIQVQCLPNGGRVAGEQLPPESVGDQDDVGAPG